MQHFMHIYVYVYRAMNKTTKQKDLSPVLRAMADGTRLKILLMLEAKPRTVTEIVNFFDLSQPTITRHLQTLTGAGLVKRIRKGQNVQYELAVDKVKMVCSDLVACFPCCCISMKTNESNDLQALVIQKRRSKTPRNKKTSNEQ
jgi:DNA-binding transcriptional ArsR family regulator